MPHVKVPQNPREQPLPIKIQPGTRNAEIDQDGVIVVPAPRR
jgi:hypothetical protein